MLLIDNVIWHLLPLLDHESLLCANEMMLPLPTEENTEGIYQKESENKDMLGSSDRQSNGRMCLFPSAKSLVLFKVTS